jgi:prepilin-type processing-associated H-X9-DG protein
MFRSYAWNLMVDNYAMASLSRPAQIALIADCDGTGWMAPGHSCIGFKGPPWNATAGCATTYARMQPRHNDGMDVVHADGHVKWYSAGGLLSAYQNGGLVYN